MSLRPRSVLLGPASLDRYVQEDRVLPGGGALNMAYHFAHAAVPVHLLTRVGSDHPDLFVEFLDRHHVPYSSGSIVGDGASAAIDIEMGADRQPMMDHFVEGVWSSFHLTHDDERVLAMAERLHAVLVDPVVAEIDRLAAAHRLDRLIVSGDFLGFRHYSVERFADTMRHLDLGFVGWAGDPDDPTVHGIREVAFDLRKLVVVTLGARGIRVFDGRGEAGAAVERFVPVEAVEVVGTTVGCGDAFIAAFLGDWWQHGDLDAAVAAGAAAGTLATTWLRPLPDGAYD